MSREMNHIERASRGALAPTPRKGVLAHITHEHTKRRTAMASRATARLRRPLPAHALKRSVCSCVSSKGSPLRSASRPSQKTLHASSIAFAASSNLASSVMRPAA